MTYWNAALLGLIQGLAEFFPISSSGHLAIFQTFLRIGSVEEHLLFDVLLHLGTLAAVFVAFRKDVMGIINELLVMVRLKKLPEGERPDMLQRRMISFIIIGTLPLLVAIFFKDRVEALMTNTFFVGGALLATGGLLFLSDHLGKGTKTERTATLLDILLVGCAQAVAIVPGLSRSGTTISAGLMRGFDRNFAVRFSFLLSIPAVLGANVLSLVDAFSQGVIWANVPMYIVGVLVAFVSGMGAIYLLQMMMQRGRFGGFSYYCWGAGLVTLILSLVA